MPFPLLEAKFEIASAKAPGHARIAAMPVNSAPTSPAPSAEHGERIASLVLSTLLWGSLAALHKEIGLGWSIAAGIVGTALLLRIAARPPKLLVAVAEWITNSSSLVPLALSAAVVGSILFVVVAHEPKEDDKPESFRALIEGSVGVANVTAGDQDYKASIKASPGERVKFSFYGKNRELDYDIDGLRLTYALSYKGSDAVMSLKLSSANTTTVTDTALIRSANGTPIALRVVPDAPVRYRGGGIDGTATTIQLAAAAPRGSLVIPYIDSQVPLDEFTVAILFDVVSASDVASD